MGKRLAQLYELVGTRDLVEIVILAVVIFCLLRLLGKTRGSAVVRGLGLIAVGLFLVAQVVVASFDLTELSRVLDYLLTTVLLALVVIFQPELRRGLIVLGRYRIVRYFNGDADPLADKLADAADALARECVGALIVFSATSARFLCRNRRTHRRRDLGVVDPTIFKPGSPLHDGAVILSNGRLVAAACQLPLNQPPEGSSPNMGMRHRAAACLSDETDAVVLVVSEETGRISVGVGGKLEAVPRENLSRRLAALFSRPAALQRAA